MPKVTDAYRIARREEILDAAIGCFMSRGYTRTSIADIVEASGLSAGAIYGNFPGGKGELFASVATRVLEARQAELVDRRGGSDRPLAPGEIMATIVGGIRAEPFSAILPQLWAEALIDPEIHTLVRGVFLRLKQTLADQLTEWAAANPDRIAGDPAAWARLVAPVILSAGPGFILQRALLDEFDEDGYLAALPFALVG